MSETPSLCSQVEADPRGERWGQDVREHAAACPACRDFLAGCEELGRRLRGLPLAAETMPSALRQDLLAQLAACGSSAAASGVKSAARGWHSPAVRKLGFSVALAASLAIGMVLGRQLDSLQLDSRQLGPATQVSRNIGMYIQDVTHDHYLLERIARPLEVRLTDPGELSRWLSSSLNIGFELPHTGSAFALEGGRVWHTVGRLSALASYVTEDGDRTLLFAVPAANLDLKGAPSSLIGGTRVYVGTAWGNEAHVWIAGDLAVALTAPAGKLPAEWAATFLP